MGKGRFGRQERPKRTRSKGFAGKGYNYFLTFIG